MREWNVDVTVRTRRAAVLLALALGACGGGSPADDGGPGSDGAAADAAVDSAMVDAARMDGAAIDAGATDGATVDDAAVPPSCGAAGELRCGGSCIDPNSDASYCGASADCAGVNVGASCASGETCVSGVCTPGADPRPTPDLVVSLDGVDDGACGPVASPCRTVKYAVETRATSGQLVGVMPGIYDETGAIDVPKGVSITGMGTGPSEVVLRPNYAAGSSRDFFLNLVDTALDQVGDQSLSYMTLEAHAARHVGWRAVHVQNRNDVRIHHCRITNWDRADRTRQSSTVQVESNETLAHQRWDWFAFVPNDTGPSGDYSTWVDWPRSPVTNFEFDHNLILHSGARQTNVDGSLGNSYRPGGALSLYVMKNSSIHDNEVDVRGVFSKAMSSIGALWDNVDIYRNVFRVTAAADEGWMGPAPTWKGTFALETWGHINGCEWYENVSNDGWSIAHHKDSTVRDNIILRDSAGAIGIELSEIDQSAIYRNYILGGRGVGISNRSKKPSSQDYGRIFSNIIVNGGSWGISTVFDRGTCSPDAYDITRRYVYSNLVDRTRYGGIVVRADCDSVSASFDMAIRNNILLHAGAGWAGINFEMAPGFDTLSVNVDNNLSYANPGGNNALCRRLGSGGSSCSAGARAGIRETNTVSADPFFTGVVDAYQGSPDVVTVNNTDAAATRQQGRWTAGSSAELRAFPRGARDAAVHAVGPGDWFEFQASDLSPDRPTVVALWWPRNFAAGRSSAVPVTIYDGDDTTPIASFTVDQATWDSSEWYYLGRFVFTSGRARLRIHSVDDGSVVADAALWVKMGYGYRLAAGSPAINAGSSAVESVVTEDFFGNAVPRGSAPDIGIHER
ncbi:MAG: hypothetical protein GXP55_03905 [Deltaproteobacteria bacterium]|nr:hypothetical protein [Deltaproteobacteria bacterium]